MEQAILTPEGLGKAIRADRKNKKLSQGEVGQSVGIEQHTISKLEAGKTGVGLGTLFRVLAALELELVVRSRQKPDTQHQGDTW